MDDKHKDMLRWAEERLRAKLASNGRNPDNMNEGIPVGSVLHMAEVILKELDYLRAAVDSSPRRTTVLRDVQAFHEKFAVGYGGPPRGLDLDLSLFRSKFMFEELAEYLDLSDGDKAEVMMIIQRSIERRGPEGDLAKQLDALVDLVYVAVGTAALHGFDFDEAWRRVQEANMRKVRAQRDGSDTVRGAPQFDVAKPPGWQPPDLSDLVDPRLVPRPIRSTE